MKNVFRVATLVGVMFLSTTNSSQAQGPLVSHNATVSSGKLSSGTGLRVSWTDTATWGNFNGSATAQLDATLYVNVYGNSFNYTFPMNSPVYSSVYAMYPGYSISVPAGRYTSSNPGTDIYNAAVANGITLPSGMFTARFEVRFRDYTNISPNLYINNFTKYDGSVYPYINTH